ncbi:MAG: branched-chain amino acid ABC transporter permease [Oscillospiraceae bacterium]|nr:branched-chain amino acid ABC transporter permease [Oscillospiraceae bacterium]
MINGRKSLIQRVLTIPNILLIAIGIVLIFVPQFLGVSRMAMVTRIMIFSVFAMSYDILRGYIGLVHLGYGLFIGGGAYFVGVMFLQFGVSYLNLLLAVVGVTIYCVFWALVVGRISAKSGFLATAMVTMAFGEIMRNVAERWRTVTGGQDGMRFPVPEFLANRANMYYVSFAFLLIMAFILYKFTTSPTGRVWQAVRENEQRAIFLGYDTNRARTIALLVAAISGGFAGIMFGLFNHFVNTDQFGMQMTYNAMLYSILGGSGTLFGSILGSALVISFQTFLLDLRHFHSIFDRWLLFFGALYIVVVMFMPHGIAGFYLSWKEKYAAKKKLRMEAAAKEEVSS